MPPPRGVDPETATEALKLLQHIYDTAADAMLRTVARRLAADITDEGWTDRKAREILVLQDELRAIIFGVDRQAPGAVQAALGQAYGLGAAAASRVAAPVTTRTAVLADFAGRLTSQLQGTHLPVLRATLDLYQTAVTDAEVLVQAGVGTRRKAVAAAVDRLLQSGQDRFVDRAGRRWHLDAYTRMAGRTVALQLAVQGQLDTMAATGRDIVLVSDSPRECPLCRPLEGKLLSITGASVGQVVRSYDSRLTVSMSVAQARDAGLWHSNCRHRADPFVPGVTARTPPDRDPAGYKAQQKQRALEVALRDIKRRLVVLEQIGDPERLAVARSELRVFNRKLAEHTDRHGLLRRRDRERPVGPAPGD